MSDSGSWRTLNVSVDKVPKLLIRTHFTSSGYEVQLTDLSHIWEENLTREDVIRKASEAGTSIDPGQDDEQFKIFLDKIESALNGEDATSLNLQPTEDKKALVVDLSARLPKPLPPFAWTLHLKLVPRQYTESLLVTPLLHQASRLHYQIEQLINELHDKDRVISKICDRLETSGNDLTTVFPGVSNIKTSRKKGQREQLARHVKGLADFNEDTWRAHNSSAQEGHDLQNEEVNDVFKDIKPVSNPPSFQENWWQQLGEVAKDVDARDRETDTHRAQSIRPDRNAIEAEDSVQEDDFQTQGTPPHLKSRSPEEPPDHESASPSPELIQQSQASRTTAIEDDESTTEDEDDLDAAPSKPRKVPESNPAPPKSASPAPKRLGAIGGLPKDVPSVQYETPAEQSAVTLSPDTKPRARLGKIGGKSSTPVASTSEIEAEETEINTNPPPKSSKMGMIGGRGRLNVEKPSSPEATHNEARPEPSPGQETRSGRSVERHETPTTRETSEERADKKRDQLKRELDAKAKVPAKKKRKF